MLYIPNKSNNPYFNQAFEQAVFEMYTDDDILLVWRNSSAVVCGRNQNIFAEISVAEAEKEKVAVVRRDTGGGTVYHDMGNVNYTLISDTHGIGVDYDAFLEHTVGALCKMGIPAHRNKACDIAINGMKISGSAQRQTKERVLHHGTLLYNTNLDILNRFSRDRSDGFESKAIASARSTVTNISEHIASPLPINMFMQEFADIMLDGGKVISPVPELLERTEQLMNEKYSAWEWNYGKNPAFSCERTRDGIYIRFSAKHGIINDFILRCDNKEADAHIFIGARLEASVIHELCSRVMSDKTHADILYNQIL